MSVKLENTEQEVTVVQPSVSLVRGLEHMNVTGIAFALRSCSTKATGISCLEDINDLSSVQIATGQFY